MRAQGATFALALHADYRCRNTGVCCSSGWPIPVERRVLRPLERALAARRLHLDRTEGAAAGRASLLPRARPMPADAGALLGQDAAGRCLFLETRGGLLCAIHRQLGEEALPSACRHFPRVAVLEPRGVRISLSHYCPTAARLLLRDDAGLDVVRDPPAFPPRVGYQGLEARDGLPPLLAPGVLMDTAGLDAWEECGLAVLADDRLTPERAVAVLRAAAERVRVWRPGSEPLAAAVREAFAASSSAPVVERSPAERLTMHADALGCVPPRWRPARPLPGPDALERHIEPGWPGHARTVRRYLAARFFASWQLYSGGGLRSHVAAVAGALDVLSVEAAGACAASGAGLDGGRLIEALRAADELLLHLARPAALAALFDRSETDASGYRPPPGTGIP